MRHFAIPSLSVILFVVPIARSSELLVAQPASKLWIEGTSTLKAFTCRAPEFTLKVNADGSGAVAAVLAGRRAVRTTELTIPSARLDCNNATMNEYMLKAIKANEHAAIRFSLTDYDVAANSKGAEGMVRGTLSLGGVEHPVAGAAVATDAGNGAVRIAGSYEIALSAFDLTAPTLMYGSIKVGDKVQVKFDMVLKN
ncbi:MAG: YceI family protein [bacterium]